MLRKILCIALSLIMFVLSVGFFQSVTTVSALTQQELEDKIDDIDDQIEANKDKLESLKDKKESQKEYLDTLENQIETVESKATNLQTQLQTIDNEVEKLNKESKQLDNEITQISGDIKKAEKDIVQMQNNISQTSDQLAAKLRSAYINGNESTLKILMGADSLASFLTRLEMMKRSSENDKRVIEEFKEKATKLKKTKKGLEEDRTELDAKKIEVTEKKTLSLQKKSDLEKKQKEYDATMTDLEGKYSEIEGYISDLDKSSAAYKNYIKELEAEKAEADAEIDRLLSEYYATQTQPETTLPASNADPTQSSNSGSGSGGSAGPSYTAKGDWLWPLGRSSCYISSGYGYRNASIGGNAFHGGIDIAGSGITGKPVYATRAGKVISAVTSNRGYGIYVLVDHGDGYSSLYAHMSARYVSVGDNVKKGEMIGRVGSTGNVTGPHLHFEVRYYGEKKNPSNYVKKP